jgi:hypothetical protein
VARFHFWAVFLLLSLSMIFLNNDKDFGSQPLKVFGAIAAIFLVLMRL